MNLFPFDLAADRQLFDNVVQATIGVYDPATDARDPVDGTFDAIIQETGESAGLTVADTQVSDGGSLDGQLTSIIVWYPQIKKYDSITINGQTYIVDVSSKKAWQTFAECSCRDG